MNSKAASNASDASDQRQSKIIDALICSASNHPQALAALAQVVLAKGEEGRARTLALRARALAPKDAEIGLLTAEVLNFGIPGWHFSIVRDELRNAAFDAALRRATRPGMRILDIGSGTGLLAMMAARAGAKQVISCEIKPAIAEAAGKVAAANGYADRVRIVAKHSDDLDPVADVGGLADLLVSEIISNDMLSEDVLPTLEKAVSRLLKPGGQIIPAASSVRVALAHSPRADKRRMGIVQGFDLTGFNELAPKVLRLKWSERDLTLLSDAADLFTFDFASGGPFPACRSSAFVTAGHGAANGIVQWIHLQMDDVGEYENHPIRTMDSNWALLFYPFSADLQCNEGDRIKISGSHDRQRMRIWMDSTQPSGEADLPLPSDRRHPNPPSQHPLDQVPPK